MITRTDRHSLRLSFEVLLCVSQAGCAALVEYATYIGTTTEHRSQVSEDFVPASGGAMNGGFARFGLGENTVSFFSPRWSGETKSVGVILPLIPVPSETSIYPTTIFYLGVRLSPGPKSFVIVDPEEYRIVFKGGTDAVAPNDWWVRGSRGCNWSKEPSEVRAYGMGCSIFLYYGQITTAMITEFRLVPAVVDADEVLYGFPDIEYEQGTYIEYQ